MLPVMSAKPDPNLDVIERYGKLSPQLITYPEVPALLESFTDRAFRDHIERSNAELIPKPIALFLRVPELTGRAEFYVEQLLREIELLAPLFDQDRDVTWVQWHGAPDQLGNALSDRVLDSIDRRFHIASAAVFVQHFDIESSAVDFSRLGNCGVANVHRVRVGFTFGMRQQSLADFGSMIRSLCDARPDCIDLVDGALLRRDVPPASALDAATRLSMLELAVDHLASAGFPHVHKDQFGLEDPHCNTVDADTIGLGPGAISMTGDGVIQSPSGLEDWRSALDARHLPVSCGISLAREDRERINLLKQLLKGEEVDTSLLENCPAVGLDATAKLQELENCALVQTADNRIVATSRGRYLWRILAQCLDPDLQRRGRVMSHDGHSIEERS